MSQNSIGTVADEERLVELRKEGSGSFAVSLDDAVPDVGIDPDADIEVDWRAAEGGDVPRLIMGPIDPEDREAAADPRTPSARPRPPRSNRTVLPARGLDPPMDRSAAVERVERLVETVESDSMPVPVREIWVYGEISLGLDPIDRLDVYLTKDILLGGDNGRSEEFQGSYGVKGIGNTVRAEWASEFPEFVRANDNGYAAPEKCLAAHLIGDDEPIHLEVCNASFEDNVTQRLRGAMSRENYEQILDPRGVCLWVDGQRSEEALERLRSGELVLPTLPDALEMLGMDEGEAREAAATLRAYRERQEGATVRGDVV